MTRTLSILAALLFALPVRADPLADAAKKVAASLASQLASHPEVKALSVSPLQESGSAKGSGTGKSFAQALATELGSKFSVRDWEALDKAQREQALHGAARLSAIQAIVAGEVSGGEAGAPLRVNVRAVAVATGLSLASESAQLGAPAAEIARPRNLVEAVSVDVAMRMLADELVSGFAKLPGNVRYRRLAVLPFSELGAETKKRELGAVVTAELSTSLRRDHGLLLVERQKLQQVMGEIKLGQSGVFDASSAPEIGKLSDAQALVIGSVAETGDRYRIDARIVSTETSEALATASQAVPAANLVSLSSDAVVLRSKKDALFRSLLIPGWGQIYNREPAKGYVFMGAEAASLLSALTFQQLGKSAEQQYKTATPDQLGATPEARAAAAEALRVKAESRYTLRNVSLFTAGGLWLLNVLDAYFSGVDGDRLLGGNGGALTTQLSPSGSSFAYSRRF